MCFTSTSAQTSSPRATEHDEQVSFFGVVSFRGAQREYTRVCPTHVDASECVYLSSTSFRVIRNKS